MEILTLSERYPLRKKTDILQYLTEHDSYHPMNSWNGGFCVAWNVKMHGIWGMEGKGEDFDTDPELDEAWAKHVEADQDLFWQVCSSLAEHYGSGDWTRYPGVGHAKFYFNGRSGGWMVLKECDLVSGGDNPWAMNRMVWSGRSGYEEWLKELHWRDLMAWYRMIRDVDIEIENRDKWFKAELNFQRSQWEEDYKRERAYEEPEAVPGNFAAGGFI